MEARISLCPYYDGWLKEQMTPKGVCVLFCGYLSRQERCLTDTPHFCSNSTSGKRLNEQFAAWKEENEVTGGT